MSAVSVRGLTVQRGRRTVLEDVSFSAAAGALTAILGAAGSGKTSLLAAIAGLLPAARGAVFCDSREVTRFSPRRRGIGFLAPGSVLPAGRNAGSALRRLAGSGAREAAAGLLAALGPGLGEVPPAQLSHGQSQLVLAAARLLPQGAVLLVDEAGVGLDDAARAGFAAQLRGLAGQGRSVVFATRSAPMALLADHLVLLGGGRVLQAGTPASVYAEPRDGAAARLTGPANILGGRIRELRPQGFVWAAGGRFVQAAEPDMPRPVLGAEVQVCLRPERMYLLTASESAENMLEAEIADVRSAGALLHVAARTALGDMMVAVPSWRPHFYPAAGQLVRIAWPAEAGWVLP